MRTTRRIRILVMADRRFPCTHSFLDGVIAKRLPDHGVEVVWLVKAARRVLWPRWERWRETDVLLLPSLPGLRFGRLLFEYLLAVIASPLLVAKLWGKRINVIFVRNDPAYLIVALLVRMFLRRPIVYQLSHLKEEDLLFRAQQATGLRRLIQRAKAVTGLKLRRLAWSRLDRIFAISKEMVASLERAGYACGRATVVPLGVDSGIEDESCPGDKRIAFARYVIYVGTMAEVRRPTMMIDAFCEAAKSGSDFGLVLVGGGGEPAARNKLQAYAYASEFKARIQFIGDVPRADLAPMIRDAICGLSVMPATAVTRTISPTKLMEYLQFGCPVIASCGIPEQDEIVRDSGGGRLVQFDLTQVADAIAWMVRNEDEARLMGCAGRDYVLRNRDYGPMAAEVANVLHALGPVNTIVEGLRQ